jgi:apolipoprotein D and lipocalin family protein
MKCKNHSSDEEIDQLPRDLWAPIGRIRKRSSLEPRMRQRTRKTHARRCTWIRAVALGLGLAFALTACRSTLPALEVVNEVDLDRYAGQWYEIASFPQRFQRGCVASQAHYTPMDDGRIRVENACRDGSFDAEWRRAEGVAWVTDPSESDAKLKVQFFWPFRGDYWIIELDPDYRYAVIGHPSRDYLWILSRTPAMNPQVYEELLARIAAHGFDPGRLRPTPQPGIGP